MMHWYNTQYLGMHFFWWVLWIIVLAWIFSTRQNATGQKTDKESPLDILKRRFANGEIDDAEYEAKRKILDK